MKSTLTAFIAGMALVCTLSACGGGGGGPAATPTTSAAQSSSVPAPSPASAPVTSTAPATGKTIKIAMYGDSTAYGTTFETGTYTQSPHNEPTSLQFALQQKYGTSVTVENKGVPGSTCPQWLWGQKDVKQAWTVEMANSDAQIVTMNCAINDAFLPTETDQDFQFLYGQFAQIAREYGKVFIIMSPNPINDAHNQNIWSLVHDEQYVSQVQQVAIVDQWNTIQTTMPDWASHLPDSIHPDDSLYEYKAQVSMATIGPIVQSMIPSS